MTVEHPPLSGPGCIPSWAIVAALVESERRTVRRPWLARLLGQRGPAGAGNRGGSTPGAGHSFFVRLAERLRERVRVGAITGVSGTEEARTLRAAGMPARSTIVTRVSAKE